MCDILIVLFVKHNILPNKRSETQEFIMRRILILFASFVMFWHNI